jgi:hypothetical protein
VLEAPCYLLEAIVVAMVHRSRGGDHGEALASLTERPPEHARVFDRVIVQHYTGRSPAAWRLDDDTEFVAERLLSVDALARVKRRA